MICRLCLTETQFYLSLKNAEKQDEETEDIAEIIRKHFDLSLDINSDLVCTVCWQQINEFHTFYLFIEEKQKELSHQSPLPTLTGTRNDATPIATDDEHEMVMQDKVAAKDENEMDIKNECLMHLNTAMVAINSLSEESMEATLREATENLDIKNEFVDEVETPSENDSEYEMNMTDEDDDEVDMKSESLIEISSPIITENSLGQCNKETTPQEATENLNIVPSGFETNTNDIAETTRTLLHTSILKCELCAQNFEDFGNLKQHFKMEHRCKGYVKCCNKSYYRRKDYEGHLEWHSNPNLWKCEPCNRVFSSQRAYKHHLLKLHPKPGILTFQCEFCPRKFSRRLFLDRHIKYEHEKNFKCDECNKDFTTFVNLRQHKTRFHLRGNDTKCDICGTIFTSPSVLRVHKASVHGLEQYLNYQCPSCPMKFALHSLFVMHREESHSKEKIKCDKCNKEFKNLDSLKYHKRSIHPRAYIKFKCDKCNEEFKSLGKLKYHNRSIHTRTHETECVICGKIFTDRNKLKIHKAGVHGAKECLNFQCPYCPKKFALKWLLNKHTDKSHSKEMSKCNKETTPKEATENLDIAPSGSETNTNDIAETTRTPLHTSIFKCELCAQTFEDFGYLKQHFKMEHRCKGYVKCCNKFYYHRKDYEGHLEWHSNPNLWKCESCARVYSSRQSYKDHLFRLHPKLEGIKFQCKFCPRKFSRRHFFDNHVKYQHSKKNFKCDECNKDFTSCLNLKRHKERFHLRVLDTECDICGKILSNPTACRVHKATVHGLEKYLNYQCPSCPKKFTLKCRLNKHREKCHSKLKSKCDEYVEEVKNLKQHKRQIHLHANDTKGGDIFASRTSCTNHKTNTHHVEESLNFQCPHCSQKFLLEGLLNIHKSSCHNEQKSKCDECDTEFKSNILLKLHKKKVHMLANKMACDIPIINQE